MIRRIGDVRCMTIVHPLHEIRKYRESSAFFRLLGIFVCEKISGEEYGDLTDYCTCFPDDVDSNTSVSPVSIINDMVADGVVSLAMGTTLQGIYMIFSDHDLMRASYAIAYFYDAKKPYIYAQMLRHYDCFRRALLDFETLEKGINSSDELKYIWAAKSNCKRRMNELYIHVWNAIEKGWYVEVGKEKNDLKQKLWDRYFYSSEEINEDIQKILDYEPDFYGAYAIRGFALELDEDCRFESVSDLIKTVDCIGDKPYASYVYYRIGKYFESIRGNLEQKWIYYRKSWELDPRNYRALYKVALQERTKKNSEEAEKLWKQLLEILQPKEHSKVLQPIECAYLYKTYILLGDLKIENSAFQEGIYYFGKALEIYNNKFNEELSGGFYPWMFCDKNIDTDLVKEDEKEGWEIYKEAAREKLRINVLYRRITNAASGAGLKQLYDKYYRYTLDE